MPRNTARHRLILDMIEAALRAAGAPVDEAIDFNNPKTANEEGKYLERNGLYLSWSSDDNGVDLSVSTYPGDTFFQGGRRRRTLQGRRHRQRLNGVVGRCTGLRDRPPGLDRDLPDVSGASLKKSFRRDRGEHGSGVLEGLRRQHVTHERRAFGSEAYPGLTVRTRFLFKGTRVPTARQHI